ncbi:hypothetical protein NQ176_g9480 [Zarea fungicola]|uniref:Uncharacterized protein n=1 Tax=Zarea fungicola TaxID=93591 RepID=A0ACC1MLD8_9HYPO|nr:hypothetical protein NQ176_g9480 [Lecanicillium fungicola]
MKHPDFRNGPSSEAELADIMAAAEDWGFNKNCLYCFLIRRNVGMEHRMTMHRATKKKCQELDAYKQKAAAERRGLPPILTPAKILPEGEEKTALWSTEDGEKRLRELEETKRLRIKAHQALPSKQITMLPTIPEEDEDQSDVEEERRCYDYFDEPHVLAHQFLQADSQRLHIYGRIFRGSFIPRKYLQGAIKISFTESPYSLAVKEMGRLLSVYYN